MNQKIAIYLKMLVFAISCYIYTQLQYVIASADATGQLVMEILQDDEKIAHTEDDIYYLNSNVRFKFGDASDESVLGTISGEISSLKETYPSDTIDYYVEEYYGVAKWEGDGFAPYHEVDKDGVLFSPEDSEDTKHTVKFKTIRSYKIYREVDGEKEICKVIDITESSNVYQIYFDSIDPKITYSGEVDFSKQVSQGTEVALKITDEIGLSHLILSKNGEEVERTDLKGDKRIIEYDYMVALTKDNSEKDTIVLKAYDLSGNYCEYTISYVVDNEKPYINVTGVSDGKIYKGAAEVKAYARDNSERVNLFYKCEYTDDEGNVTCLENYTKEYEDEASIGRTYDKEGIYDIAAFAYDLSGNYTEIYRVSFGVDRSAPIVSLDNVVNGKIYKDSVSAIANIRELFFENAKAEMICDVSNGIDTKHIDMSPAEIKARNNRYVYNFSQEGIYHLRLKAWDESQYVGESICDFTIDKTYPEIEILVGTNSVEGDKSFSTVLNKRPEITVKSKDNLLEYEINATLYRKGKSTGYAEVDTSRVVSIGKSADFSVAVPSEGEFMLKVTATDMAGNTDSKEVQFIVDEKPPVIGYVNNFNEKYLKYFAMPESLSEYITDMTAVKYKAYLNSKEIKSADIKKDGKYILQVVAEDEAGNTSEEDIAFIIDATAPKVVVKGIDGDGKVKKDDIVKLSLLDSDDYFKKAFINGEQIQINDNKEITVRANNYGDYDISVVAADYAGNEVTEVIKMQCNLSANPFTVKLDKSNIETLTKNDVEIRESFLFGNWCLKYVIIAGIIVLLGVILVVFAFVDMKGDKG